MSGFTIESHGGEDALENQRSGSGKDDTVTPVPLEGRASNQKGLFSSRKIQWNLTC